MGDRLVVVGNGMAGLRLLEELGPSTGFTTTVIGAEPHPAYNRVLLSSMLAGDSNIDDVLMQPREWYEQRGVALQTGKPAVALDTERREVRLADGSSIPFDRLVLATGASPVRLEIPGAGLEGVTTFRDLGDVEVLRAAALGGASAVVVGAGLLGIEAAYGLSRLGAKVTLLHLMDRIMERQLDDDGAALLQQVLEARGIRVRLAAQVRAILGERTVEGAELADGEKLACNLLVMAVGVHADTALAATAGLATARGIVVDDRMETSAPGIYAIGDCAKHRGCCYGLIEPAYEQARVLAEVLCGRNARYTGSVSATHLKVSGIPVFSAGDYVGEGAENIITRDEITPAYRKLVIRNGRLVGAVLVGDTRDALWYRDLIQSRASIVKYRDTLAFGKAYAEAA